MFPFSTNRDSCNWEMLYRRHFFLSDAVFIWCITFLPLQMLHLTSNTLSKRVFSIWQLVERRDWSLLCLSSLLLGTPVRPMQYLPNLCRSLDAWILLDPYAFIMFKLLMTYWCLGNELCPGNWNNMISES